MKTYRCAHCSELIQPGTVPLPVRCTDGGRYHFRCWLAEQPPPPVSRPAKASDLYPDTSG